MSDPRPLLIYDGDCAFCTWWVRYWQRLTGAAVRYAPYQEVAAQYPQIAPAAFRRAVQYVGADGRVASGAEASLRTLAHAPGKGHWLWLYRRLPGFAWVAERAYAAIAAHRGPALRASRALWGAELWPVRLDRTAEWALRALALVWLAAFASMGVQVAGLVGPDGLLPARDYLGAMALRHPGAAHVALFPTLFWFGAGDAALRAACAAGVLAMLCALAGMARRTAFALAFVLYLSLFYAGQAFTSFQWDLLLLEAGAIAAVLGRRPALLVWTLRWLVWRFMLMSGLVKLLGDPAWRELDALRYHFMTQPLPAPLAWPAARAPDALLAAGGAATLVIELVLPFFVLLPRRPRMAAAWAFVAFQLAIVATGNYGFFNLLVTALCVALFDDAALARLRRAAPRPASPARGRPALALAFAAASVLLGGAQVAASAGVLPAPGRRLLDAIAPLRLVNPYGPFATLTRERPQIVIEGSRDGVHWQEIGLRWQPAPGRAPGWNVPHQPRLDWQLWFAARGSYRLNPWFARLLLGILRGSPEVRGLLGDDPFAGGGPPRVVRALLYEYRFADPGAWWVRRPLGLYFPAVHLGAAGLEAEAGFVVPQLPTPR